MKVKLIVTSDIHGYIYPTDYTSKNQVADFGLARIVSAIKTFREEGPCIVIDNGDAFQSSPLISYTLKYKDVPNPVSTIFNDMGLDLFNLGNHDFNYGTDVLFDYIDTIKAPLLTSNILYHDQPLGQTKIIELNQKKIAFIGITTHYIPNWEHPQNIEGFTFVDAYTHLKKEVTNLQGKVDFIIGVYHGGLERDPDTGEPTEWLTGENQGYEMTGIDGLDVLLTGHQHRSLITTINDVIVTQSGFKASEFVVVDIDLETHDIQATQMRAGDYEPDREVLAHLQALEAETQVWLDQPVGTIKDHDLLVHDEFQARLHKHPLISFLNHVQMDATGADLSCVALFNGALGFNQSITMRDLVSTYVYPNTLVVKAMTGAQLKAMMEHAAQYFDVDDQGRIKVTDRFAFPKPQHYNYDMFDGVTYTIKVSNPIGSRILDLKHKQQPVLDTDILSVVMSNYRAMGGGDYHMVLEAKTLFSGQAEMTQILADYFHKHSPVVVKHQENIRVIL